MLDFWIRVREKLDYKDLSQRDLATKINESYNTLQSWINRNRLPDAEQAVRIAEVLNTSVEFLVTGKPSTKKSNHQQTLKLLEEAIKRLQNDMM